MMEINRTIWETMVTYEKVFETCKENLRLKNTMKPYETIRGSQQNIKKNVNVQKNPENATRSGEHMRKP